jgi:hypothetical protein
MEDKAVTRGQIYLNNLAAMAPEAQRSQVPTTKEKSDLMALGRYVIDKYTSVQRLLIDVLNKEMREEIKTSGKNKSKRTKVKKSKFVLSMSWNNRTRPLNAEYPSKLLKNFMKTIMSLVSRTKTTTKGKSSFTDKNGNKQHVIDHNLHRAIKAILLDQEFRETVGVVVDFDGNYRSLAELLNTPGSVFNRLDNAVTYNADTNEFTGNGMVYNLALKDFVYMVIRMSDRYSGKTTRVEQYMNDNPALRVLFESTGRNLMDFKSTLHLSKNAEPHKRGRVEGNELIMSESNVYTFAGEKDDFRIYTNMKGNNKYLINGKIYQEKYVTGLEYVIVRPEDKIDVFVLADNSSVSFNRIVYRKHTEVDNDLTLYTSGNRRAKIYYSAKNAAFYSSDNVKRGTNDLGSFLRNSLVTYSPGSYIAKPDITLKDIKNLRYVSEIIYRIESMKDGFDRDNMPKISQIMRETPDKPLELKISVQDYVPKQYTSILDQYRNSDVDQRVIAFFDRYLQAEEDHDFMKKILSPEEKQIYQYVYNRTQ